jgi:hypothetical protein
MERASQPDSHQEWRLGNEPDQARVEPAPPAPSVDRSLERLERPLHVVTVEEFGWSLIALWALVSRFAGLAGRPLDPREARNALFAYDLANRTSEAAAAGFQPGWSGWLHLLTAGTFIVLGASDFAARLCFGLGGLLLIGMAFDLRHYAGRASAIAIGALLTLSPGITWFSRANNAGACAMAFAMVTFAFFMALIAQPSRRRAAALGVSAGLMISADVIGAATALILVAALALLGLYELLTRRDAFLNARVWLTRYSSLAGVTIATAAAVVVASQLVLGLSLASFENILRSLLSLRWANAREGARSLVLPLAFYDFALVIAAVAGILIVGTARVSTRLAFFCLLWTLLSCTFAILAAPPVAPERILLILVPAAVLGGIAVGHLHRSAAWGGLRWAFVPLVLLTLHAQSFVNFYNPAPNPGEARWARAANLFWADGATTSEAVARCAASLKHVSNATVFLSDTRPWPPALRWYLRSLRPVTSPQSAAIVVSFGAPAGGDVVRAMPVDYEESWTPELGKLSLISGLRYFFTQQRWGEPVIRSAFIEIGPDTGGPAPTLILPPEPPLNQGVS